jgi:hypothetical protein
MEAKAGEPVFADKKALLLAVEHLGDLEVVETNEYRWWGSHVGDYPVPKGMKKDELGKNAAFVIRVKGEKRKQLTAKYHQEPYDLAIVEDPNNPGCYIPMYDFYGSGAGLDEVIGAPVVKTDKKGAPRHTLGPKLIQHYHMMCDLLAAREAGDEIAFEEQQDGSWVSVAKTEARLGA